MIIKIHQPSQTYRFNLKSEDFEESPSILNGLVKTLKPRSSLLDLFNDDDVHIRSYSIELVEERGSTVCTKCRRLIRG